MSDLMDRIESAYEEWFLKTYGQLPKHLVAENEALQQRVAELEGLIREHLEPPAVGVGFGAVFDWHEDYLERCRKALEQTIKPMNDQILYQVEDSERCFYDMDEAIDDYLDGLLGAQLDGLEITVAEMKPMVPSRSDCGSPLDYVLEKLDELFGNPDGGYGDPTTPKMLEAQESFLDTVVSDYKSWICKPTGVEHRINALDWARENYAWKTDE